MYLIADPHKAKPHDQCLFDFGKGRATDNESDHNDNLKAQCERFSGI